MTARIRRFPHRDDFLPQQPPQFRPIRLTVSKNFEHQASRIKSEPPSSDFAAASTSAGADYDVAI